MGEALTQAQRVAAERDALTALLAGGVDRPGLDLAAIGRMFTRLTERHAERMASSASTPRPWSGCRPVAPEATIDQDRGDGDLPDVPPPVDALGGVVPAVVRVALDVVAAAEERVVDEAADAARRRCRR